jgi:NADH-quinone oxidoreductase subunit N
MLLATPFQWHAAWAQAQPLLPAGVLGAALALGLVAHLVWGRRRPWVAWLASLLGVGGAGVALAWRLAAYAGPAPVWGTLFAEDTPALWGQATVLGATLLGLLGLALDERTRHAATEAYTALLALALGLCLGALATHSLSVFLALETASVASYVLVAWPRQHPPSAEAGLKYFLFGAASAGLMAYGLSWLYGLGGSLAWGPATAQALAAQPTAAVAVAASLAAAGLLFKLGAAPFHFWAPDAYQAAHPALAALLSTAPKAAAAVALWRLGGLLAPHPVLATAWPLGLAVVALAGMLVGNLGALRQQHYARLLAYSGVGHTGFVVAAVAVAGVAGFQAVGLYVLAYTLLGLASFWLAPALLARQGTLHTPHWQGVAQGAALPLGLAIGVLSLAGLPPTLGFWAKLAVLLPTWAAYTQQGSALWLALLGGAGVSIVVGFAYYLPLLAHLVRRGAVGTVRRHQAPAGAAHNPGAGAHPAWVWLSVALTLGGILAWVMGLGQWVGQWLAQP